MNLNVVTHSSKPKNFEKIDVYLVDTYGETKKFYQASKIVFMGKSITGNGGQNPLEAARLGATILHGSRVGNFPDIYRLLSNLKISYKVNSINSLTKLINKFIIKPNNNKNYHTVKKIGERILIKTKNEINNLFNNEIKKT